ncbi:MAG: hypothetical protein QXK96_02430 [Candidatus Bathyarchaeia archaeon]
MKTTIKAGLNHIVSADAAKATSAKSSSQSLGFRGTDSPLYPDFLRTSMITRRLELIMVMCSDVAEKRVLPMGFEVSGNGTGMPRYNKGRN